MEKREIERLISKRDEAQQKAKQLEADLYYMQGFIQALNETITEAQVEIEKQSEA